MTEVSHEVMRSEGGGTPEAPQQSNRPTSTPSVTHVAEERNGGAAFARIATRSLERLGGIRLRIPLQILETEKHQFLGWRGQIWKCTVERVEDALAIRDAMELFFDALTQMGPGRLVAELKSMILTHPVSGRDTQQPSTPYDPPHS